MVGGTCIKWTDGYVLRTVSAIGDGLVAAMTGMTGGGGIDVLTRMVDDNDHVSNNGTSGGFPTRKLHFDLLARVCWCGSSIKFSGSMSSLAFPRTYKRSKKKKKKKKGGGAWTYNCFSPDLKVIAREHQVNEQLDFGVVAPSAITVFRAAWVFILQTLANMTFGSFSCCQNCCQSIVCPILDFLTRPTRGFRGFRQCQFPCFCL